MSGSKRKLKQFKFHNVFGEEISRDQEEKASRAERVSQLVMKNKSSGRKSCSLIHCIPKFSQVMPSKHMTDAQRALQTKIRARGRS